jgi:hypothetical protein
MTYWLAIGPAENWEIGIRKRTWGITPRHSKSWSKVQPGDTVFFYAMAPVKGIIGHGTVEKTKVDEKPFWPQEVSEKQSYWPFRITFEKTTALPRNHWETRRVVPGREGIVFQRAFQPINEERAGEWEKLMSDALREVQTSR